MSDDSPFFRAEIGSQLEEVRGVSEAAVLACGELPDPFEVDLALTEALNNAIEHAYAMETGHRIRVELYREDGGIRFHVSDWGRAMDAGIIDSLPDEVPEPDPEDVEGLEDRGRGLLIIKTTMDELAYQSDEQGNRLSFFKPLLDQRP